MATPTVQLTEKIKLTSDQVDAEAGIIRGVKILGEHSRNGRRYQPKAMKKAAGLYEDAAVNINHHADDPESRGWSEKIATLRNIRYAEGTDGASLMGDLHVREGHPLVPLLMSDAKSVTNGMGLSHSVLGKREMVGDVMEVTEIQKVQSVDLVQNPATTKNLFEQTESPMTQSIAEFTETLAPNHGSRQALEVLADQHPGIVLVFSDDDSETQKLKAIAESVYDATQDVGDVLSTLAGLKDQHVEQVQEEESSSKALAAISKNIGKMSEQVTGLVQRESAREVLEAMGAESSPQLVAELAECDGQKAMQEKAAEFSLAKLNPSRRPKLFNESNIQEQEYKPGLESFLADARA